jgi:hypothetical protein
MGMRFVDSDVLVELVVAGWGAAYKMKQEYDRLFPDASIPKDECFAEQQRLVDALEQFPSIEEIGPWLRSA